MSQASERSSSNAAQTAIPAGSEASALSQLSQRFPTHDTPASHLRNALQILELLRSELTVAKSGALHALLGAGQVAGAAHLLEDTDVATLNDVAARITAALEQLEHPEKSLEVQTAGDRHASAGLTAADVALLADIADGFSTVLHYDRLDDLRKRLAAAVGHASGSRAPADRTQEVNGRHAFPAAVAEVMIALRGLPRLPTELRAFAKYEPPREVQLLSAAANILEHLLDADATDLTLGRDLAVELAEMEASNRERAKHDEALVAGPSLEDFGADDRQEG